MRLKLFRLSDLPWASIPAAIDYIPTAKPFEAISGVAVHELSHVVKLVGV